MIKGNIKEDGLGIEVVVPLIKEKVEGYAVQSGAKPWELGEFVEIIPAYAVGSDFDIDYVVVDCFPGILHEFTFYYGENDIKFLSIRFNAEERIYVNTAIIPRRSRVRVRLATAADQALEASICGRIHEYHNKKQG